MSSTSTKRLKSIGGVSFNLKFNKIGRVSICMIKASSSFIYYTHAFHRYCKSLLNFWLFYISAHVCRLFVLMQMIRRVRKWLSVVLYKRNSYVNVPLYRVRLCCVLQIFLHHSMYPFSSYLTNVCRTRFEQKRTDVTWRRTTETTSVSH